jgi:hypothetical protein
MVCYTMKVSIARKHQQAVADAQLCQKGVDRANLNVMPAAHVAKCCCFDVIGSIGHEEGKCGEPIQNLLTCFWARETLQ